MHGAVLQALRETAGAEGTPVKNATAAGGGRTALPPRGPAAAASSR